MIEKIKEENMVSVPKEVLQDLVWNCGLAVAGMGKGEEAVGYQCRELQRYLDAGEPTADEEKISFEGYDNVEFVDFRKR